MCKPMISKIKKCQIYIFTNCVIHGIILIATYYYHNINTGLRFAKGARFDFHTGINDCMIKCVAALNQSGVFGCAA